MADNDFLKSLTNHYYSKIDQNNKKYPTLGSKPTGPPVPQDPWYANPNNALGRTIDVLSRPLYAAGNIANSTLKQAEHAVRRTSSEGFDLGKFAGDFFQMSIPGQLDDLWQGVSGKDKTTVGDAIFNWAESVTGEKIEGAPRLIGGLAADIAGDPLTYVGFGAVTKLPGIAKAIAKMKSGVTPVEGRAALPPEIPVGTQALDSKDVIKTTNDAAKIVKDTAKVVPQVSKTNAVTSNLAKAAEDGTPSLFSTDDTAEALARQIDSESNGATRLRESGSSASNLPASQRVYSGIDSFDLWPGLIGKNLDSSPVVKAAAKVEPTNPRAYVDEVMDWVKTNKAMPVTFTVGKNSHHISSAIEGGKSALTLGEYAAQMGPRNKQRTFKALEELYKSQRGPSAALPETTPTGAAPDLLSRLADRLGTAPARTASEAVVRQMKGNWLSKYQDVLDAEDIKTLLRPRSVAGFDEAARGILSRVHSPVEIPTGSLPVAAREAVQISDDVAKITESVAQRQFKPDPSKFNKTTKKGVKRDSDVYNKGLGINDRGWNSATQYTSWKALIKAAGNKVSGLYGKRRARELYNEMIHVLDEQESYLRSKGVEPIVGTSNSGLALSVGDVLKALRHIDEDVVLNQLFDIRNKPTLAINNMLGAVEFILTKLGKGSSEDEALMALAGLLKEGKGPNTFWSRITGELTRDPRPRGNTGSAAERAAAAGIPAMQKGYSRLVKTADGLKISYPGGNVVRSSATAMADALTNASVVRSLVRAATQNAARYGARFGEEVPAISDEVVDTFLREFADPSTSLGKLIHDSRNVSTAVKNAGETIEAMPASMRAAEDVAELAIREGLGPDAARLDNIGKAADAAKSGVRESVKKSSQKLHDDAAGEIIDEVAEATTDLGRNTESAMQNSVLRQKFPLAGRTPEGLFKNLVDGIGRKFNAAHGHPTLHEAIPKVTSIVRMMTIANRTALSQLARMEPAVVNATFEALRVGRNITEPAQLQASEIMRPILQTLFEGGDRADSALGAFIRNGYDTDHINQIIAARGGREDWVFDTVKAKSDAIGNNRSVAEELGEQWKNWPLSDAHDAVDFLARMDSALTSISTETSIIHEAARIARAKNMMSNVPRQGFVKLDPKEASLFGKYLPQNTYVDPVIADEMKMMDRFMSESRRFDSDLGKFVHDYLDPVMDAWKRAATIYRPGHHSRNLIGDLSLTYLREGVPKLSHFTGAAKVMAHRGGYDEWDALGFLEELSPAGRKIDLPKIQSGGDNVATVRVGRKNVSVTTKQIHDALREHGVFHDYLLGEDLFEKVGNKGLKMWSPTDGRVLRGVSKLSETRDHYVRAQHFIQALEKGSYKSLDEAFDTVAKRVRKWHPDGTDLTSFESKYMRRFFPFYSWSRKAIPLVLEAMVMKPSRILAYPKFMYNLAQANGINPDSLSNPFPHDQLFPSFITENLTGPVAMNDGNYYRAQIGLSQEDVLKEFVADPAGAARGMLNPFIKTPISLLTGTNFDTGSKMVDSSEYLEGQLPGLSHAGSISGVSPLGTLQNLLPGGPGGVDVKRSVERGDREQFDLATLVSYLTGVSAQNISKPSYQRIAEREQRNK